MLGEYFAFVLLLTIACCTVNAAKVPFRPAKENVDEFNIKKATLSFPDKGFVVNEKIRANAIDFVVTYEAATPEGTAIIVDDYRSYIRAVLPHDHDICVLISITPSRTFQTGQEFAEWKTNIKRTMIKEEITIYYGQQGPPLKNTNILCQEARDVCKGLPVYWGGIEISNLGTAEVVRPKRDVKKVCKMAVMD